MFGFLKTAECRGRRPRPHDNAELSDSMIRTMVAFGMLDNARVSCRKGIDSNMGPYKKCCYQFETLSGTPRKLCLNAEQTEIAERYRKK